MVVPEEEFDGSVVDFLPAERRKVSVMKIGSLNKKVSFYLYLNSALIFATNCAARIFPTTLCRSLSRGSCDDFVSLGIRTHVSQ